MKKVVLVGIVITVLLAGIIFVGGYFISKNDKTSNPQAQSTSTPTANGTQTSPSGNTSASYTMADTAKHSTSSDCWIVIHNQVFNVTNFLSQHPGGADRITPYCGKDATEAFDTQGGEGSHSSTAESLKQQYLIGSLQN